MSHAARVALLMLASLASCRPGGGTAARQPAVTSPPAKRAVARQEPRPQLPEGVNVLRYSAEGDLDADGVMDSVVLVFGETEEGDQARGLAVLWGSGAQATVLGAGQTLRVLKFGDTERTTPRSAGVPDTIDELSWLMRWDLLAAVPDPRGGKTLIDRRPRGAGPRRFDFLPAVRGDAIRLDGGDSAWVLYLTAGGDWYFAPLGY